MPSYDDTHLLEMLVLERAQKKLNWETILKKYEGYRAAFYELDVKKVVAMADDELEALLHNPAIILDNAQGPT